MKAQGMWVRCSKLFQVETAIRVVEVALGAS